MTTPAGTENDLTSRLVAAREANRGAACTTASILTVLRALGARDLPPLEVATRQLGAAGPLDAPPLRAYVRPPGRARAPLDRRIERLSAAHGLAVQARTSLVVPWRAPAPQPGSVLVANLAFGQERPGHWGTWGWNALRPGTYGTGGHSVVFAQALPGDGRLVIDPNLPGVQRWPAAGWSVTATRIRPTGRAGFSSSP